MNGCAKLGSLFDGIGGFPLVASWYDIEAAWASEIEPAPISITKRHFPFMLHLGDITKINGAEIEPVDVLTFGSPCQDLSVAGKRAGMKHGDKGDEETTRSGLFMEAIRIIREMRAATIEKYPRIIVWENVPGAFSSNEGEDFRTVLEEICRIADPGISIPGHADGWTGAGLIMGDGFSVGWRKLDAQFWGVPQRRKRIYLVADFAGRSAAEILFKPESMRRHTSKGRAPWERFAGGIETGVDSAECRPINTQIITRHNALGEGTGFGLGEPGDPAYTLQAGHEHGVFAPLIARSLTARNDGSPCIDRGPEVIVQPVTRTLSTRGHQYNRKGQDEDYLVLQNPMLIEMTSTHNTVIENGISPTLTARMGTGGNQVNAVMMRMRSGCEGGGKGALLSEDKALTLKQGNDQVLFAAGFSAGQAPSAGGIGYAEEQAPTLRAAASGTNQVPAVVIPISDKATRYKGGGRKRNQDGSGNGLGVGQDGDPSPTITAGDRHAVLCMATGQSGAEITKDISPTLNRNHEQPIVAGLDCRNGRENGDLCGTLQAKANGGFSYNCIHPVRIGLAVRRLIPLETDRLQGYPDDWTRWGHDGKEISDTARYKADGNSVALPCVDYIMSGIADVLFSE